jgi:hypothetical protein
MDNDNTSCATTPSRTTSYRTAINSTSTSANYPGSCAETHRFAFLSRDISLIGRSSYQLSKGVLSVRVYYSSYIIAHCSDKASRPYTSLLVEFDTHENQTAFLRDSSSFAPESSHIKFNIYGDNIIEIIMPESLIHSVVGDFVKIQILDSIRSQMYLPGVSYDGTKMRSVGSGCISISTCHTDVTSSENYHQGRIERT